MSPTAALLALSLAGGGAAALIVPSLRKAGHPEPTLLLLGSFVLTCGRATLAFATTVPHLMLGELLVVTGAATCFTLVRSPSDKPTAATPAHAVVWLRHVRVC